MPEKTIRRDGLPLLLRHTGQTTSQEQPPAIASCAIVYLTLEEGPQILTQPIGCDPESVSIDPALRVEFKATGEPLGVPRFVPA